GPSNILMFVKLKYGLALRRDSIQRREYLIAFSKETARYVNVELTMENLLPDEANFPLELQFAFYNDAGQLKASMNYFKNFTDKRKEFIIDSGYGAQKPGFWYEDNYTVDIVFMDQLLAVVPFKVAKENEPLTDPNGHAFSTKHEIDTAAPEKEEETKPTFEEAKQELEDLIGLGVVKEQINELATYLQFLKIRQAKGLDEKRKPNLHAVFTGNPGTGKTTVARMLGKIYHSLDLLEHGKVHEVGRADLVGEYIGQTAPKTKKALQKAKGGILFIDEAYALTDRGDDGKDFGKEVIEVLLKSLTDNKGDVAIIFAGYPDEMKSFLTSNPGLSSRLSNVIHFPDYAPDELMEIGHYAANSRSVTIAGDAEVLVHRKLVEAYRTRNKHFGNARFVNGIVEEAKQNMALRLMREMDDPTELDEEMLSTITHSDVEKIFKSNEDDRFTLPIDEPLFKDALQQLHNLVGLDELKKEVEDMAKLVRYYREIGKDIRKSFSLHCVFKGNPGTGKTTVARVIVQIYKALGILERGQLIEVARKDLVAGFVGQTAIKTSEMIDQAKGGGLFIDEAYALSSRGGGDFGSEAIETLLKRMEDERGEFMVIVAGYPEEMRQFLEANPGLMSRFDKEFVFKDYTVKELIQIAQDMAEKEDLVFHPDAITHLEAYIGRMLQNKHKYFGNARTVRKIVDEAMRKQNLRMADMSASERTPEAVRTIIMSDIEDFKLVEQDNQRRTIGFGGSEG
ncbi:MAG: AAA family ATPase, partial [Bacteroidota bacterium]